MALIDHLNFDSTLKQSTASRTGAADGNVYFDVANNLIELIGVNELATLNYGKSSGAITATVVAAAGTFTRSAGSFVTDGFKVGHSVTFANFTNAGNNVTKTLLTVTALVLTVTDVTGLVNETGDGDETVTNAVQANPYSVVDGITMRALYNFENQERRTDEELRKYKRGTDGDYRFSGAFNFVNGVKLDGTDRDGIRGSGFIEYADQGDGKSHRDRTYHGVKSLNPIEATTVPYYALVATKSEATLQAATWPDFGRPGDINEVIQVQGDVTYDAGTTTFDFTEYELVVRVRSWGFDAGETTSVLTGIAEFSGFSAGYGVGETLNVNNPYDLADVYGAFEVAPWTGMSLEKMAVAQTETGFVEIDGDFTWVLANTGGVPGVPGTVAQCAAYLDALALQDADIDDAVATEYNGKKGRIWYTRNTSGKVVTSTGLFIEGLSSSEKRNIIMTDDAGATKTYPSYPEVQITVGTAAVADPDAWYHVFEAAAFDTAGAVTVTNHLAAPVKGNVLADAVGGVISFSKTYTANENMVVVVEGDGGAAQAITYFTFIDATVIPVSCIPATDTNS